MKRLRSLAAISALGLSLSPMASATSQDVRFGQPVKVNADGWGYEPSIDVDSTGTLYVTAHKGSVVNEGTRLSSFLWSSRDAGATWAEMASPDHLAESKFSFEGDIAVDRQDRLYFVDTYGADNWLSRWSKDGTLERSAPAVSASVFDDRPWIATQGADVVWLLTTDVGTRAAGNGPPEPAAGSGWAYSAVLYRSVDGGVTWSLGTAFPDSQFCGLAASPSDEVSLAVACVVRTPEGQRLAVYRSADAGLTWSEHTVHMYGGRADSFISIAYDQGGTLVTAFAEAAATGHRLYVARGTARGWTVRDVTPFRGAFQHVWTTADAKGKVGLAFYGTDSPTPSAASDWHVYAGVAESSRGSWAIARADKVPVIRAPYPPADFLQCIIAPNGRLYVAYSRSATTDVLHAPPPDFDHDIFVVSERAGSRRR